MVLGAMIAFDMGGPVTNGLTRLWAFAEHVLGPNTAVNIAMGILPWGWPWLASWRPTNTPRKREALRSATILGLYRHYGRGHALAVADSRRVILHHDRHRETTGLSAALGVVNLMIMPTLAATIFVNNKLGHLLAVAAGVLTTALLVNLLKREAKTEEEEKKRRRTVRSMISALSCLPYSLG